MSNKTSKLSLNIRKTRIVQQALDYWQAEKIQTPAQNKKCFDSIHKLVFDWKLLSCICLGAAIFFLASAILASITLLQITEKQFFVILSLCSAGIFSYSYYLMNNDSTKGKLCGFLNFIALTFLSSAVQLVSDDPLLWTSVIGGIIGLIMRSGLTWGISLGLFGLWFCLPNLTQNLENINFTMSGPRQSALIFGILTMGVSIAIKKASETQNCFDAYKSIFIGSLVTSYIYIFGSIFLLSAISTETQLTMVEYAWAFALAGLSLAAIFCGIRNRLPITIRFGVVFFLLNIIHQYVNFCANYIQPVLANFGLAAILWGISLIACFIACEHDQWEKKKHKGSNKEKAS